MTFEELLQSCATGKLPRVTIDKPVRHSETKKGVVVAVKDETTIKNKSHAYKGCVVRFDDMAYDIWFYAEPGTDKRTHYMSELKLEKEIKK